MSEKVDGTPGLMEVAQKVWRLGSVVGACHAGLCKYSIYPGRAATLRIKRPPKDTSDLAHRG